MKITKEVDTAKEMLHTLKLRISICTMTLACTNLAVTVTGIIEEKSILTSLVLANLVS